MPIKHNVSTQIIDGKQLSSTTRIKLKAEVAALQSSKNITPGLAVIIVGNNPASAIYVRNKVKSCAEVGVYSEVIQCPEETSLQELLSLIETLNYNKTIHGILVQLPLPDHIDEMCVIDAISAEKDVDGFNTLSAGNLMVGGKGFIPCTPQGCLALIRSTGQEIAGKHAVIIGRSNIVGKPLAMLLLQYNATVTICHSKTKNLKEIVLGADILIAALGKAEFITGDMIKPGAIVIDVGINRDNNNKLLGDVNFAQAQGKAAYITPVPGGVGPMTITMLLQNTIEAAQKYA